MEAEAAGDVILAVEPDPATAGERVTLTLRNGSSGTIGYNLCTSQLERESSGAWQAVPSDRVCTMELRTLAPGEVASYPLELPVDLIAGSHRFRTSVEALDAGDRLDVRSHPFEVRRR